MRSHGEKLSGAAVHTGARGVKAGAGEILVSSTVKDLVAGSGIVSKIAVCTRSRLPGDWRLFAVTST